ncbi:uncharacterized protein LOC108253770, partial [Diaphorina citri]|uniref:Uncharacterized protein LOC108253770 n=1 Tax=Diaphorina citri TaxID=121845 RepID=A0A1S4ENU5_DIACI
MVNVCPKLCAHASYSSDYHVLVSTGRFARFWVLPGLGCINCCPVLGVAWIRLYQLSPGFGCCLDLAVYQLLPDLGVLLNCSVKLKQDVFCWPIAGSETEKRGLKAKAHLLREMLDLCIIIHDLGEYHSKHRSKEGPEDRETMGDDGTIMVTFGELFQVGNSIMK